MSGIAAKPGPVGDNQNEERKGPPIQDYDDGAIGSMQGPSESAIEMEELDYEDVMNGLFDVYHYRGEMLRREIEFFEKVQ